MFAKKAELRLPNGSTRYTSLTGCICTLVYLAAVALFGFFTMRDMVDKKFTNVSYSVQKDFWSPLDEFPPMDDDKAPKDIQIAFGVTQPGFKD